MSVEYRIALLARVREFVPTAAQLCEFVDRLHRERWVLMPDDPAFLPIWEEPLGRASGAWAEPYVEGASSPSLRWKNALAVPARLDPSWLVARRAPDADMPLADEMGLHFSVNSGGDSFADLRIRYPLAYGNAEPGYHQFLVCASRDLVRFSDFGEALCQCGVDLAYEVPSTTIAPICIDVRLRAVCPGCNAKVTRSNPAVAGASGDASRFAVVVDFSDQWPTERRAGEAPAEAAALRQAGYPAPSPASPGRSPEDDPQSAEYDSHVLRSPYGDPAPPIAPEFLALVEQTMGTVFEPVSVFY